MLKPEAKETKISHVQIHEKPCLLVRVPSVPQGLMTPRWAALNLEPFGVSGLQSLEAAQLPFSIGRQPVAHVKLNVSPANYLVQHASWKWLPVHQ